MGCDHHGRFGLGVTRRNASTHMNPRGWTSICAARRRTHARLLSLLLLRLPVLLRVACVQTRVCLPPSEPAAPPIRARGEACFGLPSALSPATTASSGGGRAAAARKMASPGAFIKGARGAPPRGRTAARGAVSQGRAEGCPRRPTPRARARAAAASPPQTPPRARPPRTPPRASRRGGTLTPRLSPALPLPSALSSLSADARPLVARGAPQRLADAHPVLRAPTAALRRPRASASLWPLGPCGAPAPLTLRLRTLARRPLD
jgi:hypothetical protein